MKNIAAKFWITIPLAAFMAVSCAHHPSYDVHGTYRSVYYWKTTFRINGQDSLFLTRHCIDRIYLRMFDVDVRVDHVSDCADVVPIATVSFQSPKPADIEIVPTVFITLNALRHCDGDEEVLAGKIVRRVLNMCSYNDIGEIGEIQFDCDWTESTRASYDRLCESARKILHKQGIQLSGTIRLHQVEQACYPFDRGVLMLYNTGAVKDPETSNSILALKDVEKYLGVKDRVDRFLSARKHNCSVIDMAYPTYSWNVAFRDDGTFDGLLGEIDLEGNPYVTKTDKGYKVNQWCQIGNVYLCEGEFIRPEHPDFSEISRVKEYVESRLGSGGSNIVYHLDSDNLSKYTDDEIEEILR